MGKDGPDWQRQMMVNTDVVVPPHMDIAAQTIPTIYNTPAYISKTHILKSAAYLPGAIAATTTTTIHTENKAGMGFVVILRGDYSDLRIRVKFDGTLLINTAASGIYSAFNGKLDIGTVGFKVLIWDPTTPEYAVGCNLAWLYKHDTSFVVEVENPDAAGHTINRVDFYWMEEL